MLTELAEVARRSEEDGSPFFTTLQALGCEVYDDLELRVMLHDRMAFGGRVHWPDLMNAHVGMLDRELQRRWLLWYDEAVREGITDFAELEEVLTARQLAWENTPHRAHEGRTPAEAVNAYLRSEEYLGKGLEGEGRLMRTRPAPGPGAGRVVFAEVRVSRRTRRRWRRGRRTPSWA